jgi:DtxR family transcriptional regulator, Mn-dependent transcriptional regulator
MVLLRAMTDPILPLVVGCVLVGGGLVFLWPGRGVISRWRESKHLPEREAIENALKHLYDAEYKNVDASLQSLAGALSVHVERATQLMARLEALRFIEIDQERLRLTPEGRKYALRIIRIHRLWERYLADETGVHETEWHPLAEEKEHKMSPGEVEALSARLGDPGFDPHGDPIPTATGELPVHRGVPLSSLREGEGGQIVHLEDEPQTIYSQLSALGLHPGMTVRVVEVGPTRIRFTSGNGENVLAPSFASSVSVMRVESGEPSTAPMHLLADVRPGERVVVEGISRACRGQQRRRLMDLGILPGTVMRPELESFGRDPTAYLVRGTLVALRRAQAEQIMVRRDDNDSM